MSIAKVADFFIAEYPQIAFNYFVITDKGVTSFSKISGLTLGSNNLKPFTEGGRKGVHILSGQDTQFNVITLEKGVGRADILESLGPMKTLIIVSLSKRRFPKRAYSVSGAILQKLSLSDFSAKESSVLISSATIAYRKIKDMPLSLGFEEEAFDAAKAVGKAIMEGGLEGAAKEIVGTAVKTTENGLIDAFKSVNFEVENKELTKLKDERDKMLEELSFWE